MAAFALGGGCSRGEAQGARGRLSARPTAGSATTASGTQPLGLDGQRDAVLHVPAKATGPLPLVVLLHGAGGRGQSLLRRLQSAVDAARVAVLAPDAREASWDVIRGDFGPDVAFINRAMARAFELVAVDPARISLAGWSDGASYALSLGLINGDLFKRVVAFSPGFYVGGEVQGRPRLFVSHGTADEILPIDRCSRVIVPRLKTQGYDVTFRQFDGGHEIPPHIAAEGFRFAAQAQ